MMDLFSLLHLGEPPEMNETQLSDFATCSLGATTIQVPWANASQSYLEDWDHDGVPNYADHYFGPGAESPFHVGAIQDEGHCLHDGSHEHDDNLAVINQQGSINNDQMLEDILVGDPVSELENYHHQEDDYSCAVASQREVIESITGLDIPEKVLADFAQANGWYAPDCGTSPSAMGNILEALGIPVVNSFNLTVDDIREALANGEKVIVGLNANEIWNPQVASDGLPLDQAVAGHAVQVTGMYQDDNEHWYMILNDTGIKDGGGEVVALKDFKNAWNDFGNQAVITMSNQQEVSHAC